MRPTAASSYPSADRISDYRVIYDVVDAQLIVTVVRAAHRREAYAR